MVISAKQIFVFFLQIVYISKCVLFSTYPYSVLFVFFSVDYGCFFDYVKHWERQLKLHPYLNVHILHYENLKLVRSSMS